MTKEESYMRGVLFEIFEEGLVGDDENPLMKLLMESYERKEMAMIILGLFKKMEVRENGK